MPEVESFLRYLQTTFDAFLVAVGMMTIESFLFAELGIARLTQQQLWKWLHLDVSTALTIQSELVVLVGVLELGVKSQMALVAKSSATVLACARAMTSFVTTQGLFADHELEADFAFEKRLVWTMRFDSV